VVKDAVCYSSKTCVRKDVAVPEDFCHLAVESC